MKTTENKFEPLKKEDIFCLNCGGVDGNCECDVDTWRAVMLNNVKSALQGLIKNIENKKNILEKGTKREIDVGIMIGLEEAKLLIKKWFPDVGAMK